MSGATELIKDIVNNGLEYLGRYYGEYEGIVYDNKDPLALGRVKVVVPEVTGNAPLGKWALPSTFSGKNFGSHIIPPNGSLLLVSFKYGNPKAPYYKPGYFVNGDIPEELRDTKNFWFKTPSGIQVELDDTNKWLKITLPGTTPVVLQLDKDGLAINSKVSLGGSPKHPIAKGDKAQAAITSILQDYLSTVETDLQVLATAINTLAPGAGSPVLANSSQRTSSTLPSIIQKIQEISSTNSKTE